MATPVKGKSHRAKQLLKELGYTKCNVVKFENGFPFTWASHLLVRLMLYLR